MERALYFTNFRNIGFDKSERIVLNNSLEKGKLGNLVILVGANNSGKSNILDGLLSFGAKRINERDRTTLSYESKYRTPKLSLCVKDNDVKFEYIVTLGNEDKTIYSDSDSKVDNKSPEHLKTFADDITEFVELCVNKYSQASSEYRFKLGTLIETINGEKAEKDVIKEQLFKAMKCYFDTVRNDPAVWNIFAKSKPNSEFVNMVNQMLINSPSKNGIEAIFQQKYGFDFFPQIISYRTKAITNTDICCRSNSIDNNPFFLTLFSKINISIDEISNAYGAFKEQMNRGVLTTLEKKINKKLEAVARDFNELYYAESDKYRFEISFDSDNVYFSLFRGTKDISLDYQSTGFKWFFNLYFSLLAKNTLRPGDILIMDEPATNLHVRGQEELRKFLKGFAIRNDLTIVLATHSPFLIDLDYLDEIRVVSMKDNISTINNDFTTVDLDDPDSLKPIKTALTTSNHVLFDPDRIVVFVEGITDYNYYIALKKKLNIKEDIIFLPIKGIGNIKSEGFKEKQREISRALMQIKKHNPVLLVDGDGAGAEMQKLNKDSDLEVITLKDIDPSFRQVENLFDKEDLRKIKAVDGNGGTIKKSSNSSIVKNFIEEYEFSKVAKENFKKVFERLVD